MPSFHWFKLYLDRRLLIIALLGFSSAIPLFLTSSTLSAWLHEEGIDYKTIGFFNLATFPYALKFLWAPFIDRMPLPYLTKYFGRRRSWLLLSQVSLMILLIIFSLHNPAKDFFVTGTLLMCITFAASTQDILMLTYQMESLPQQKYGPGEATGIFGYRMGLLVSGAGALYIASFWGWTFAYLLMSLFVGVGLITTLCIEEPKVVLSPESHLREEKMREYLMSHPHLKTIISRILAWIYASVICPLSDFMRQKGWFISLLIIFFYKLGDDLVGTMTNVFYLDLGFSKIEIANASKLFGMGASIFGGLIGGIIVIRLGFLRSLFCFGLIHALANLMYVLMCYAGHNNHLFYLTIAIEHITSGMRTTALFAYQLTLCNVSYAATQLALVVSLVNLSRTIFSSFSGWLIVKLGWVNFFFLTTVASVPSLFFIIYLLLKKKKSHSYNSLTNPD